MSEATGPYITWHDYGCEGWQPRNHVSLDEALRSIEGYPQSRIITKVVQFKVIDMAENRAGGPLIGQDVIYTVDTSTFYSAKIMAVNATTGLIRLTVFLPGATLQDQQNVGYDGTGTKSGSWRYPDAITGQ